MTMRPTTSRTAGTISTPRRWRTCERRRRARCWRRRVRFGQPDPGPQGGLAPHGPGAAANATRDAVDEAAPRLGRGGVGGLQPSAAGVARQPRAAPHPQLAELHEDLWDIVDSNLQDGDKAKGAVAVDAFPGLGKTTSVLAFAKQFHLREIAEHGEYTADGHERWPVCRVGLTGNTGMKDFNRAMLEFFGHPGAVRGTTAQFAHRALDCVLSCQVRLLVVDDLHLPAVEGQERGGGVQPSQVHRQRVPGHPGVHRCRVGGQGLVQRGQRLRQRDSGPDRAAYHPVGHGPVSDRYRQRAAGLAAAAPGH